MLHPVLPRSDCSRSAERTGQIFFCFPNFIGKMFFEIKHRTWVERRHLAHFKMSSPWVQRRPTRPPAHIRGVAKLRWNFVENTLV